MVLKNTDEMVIIAYLDYRNYQNIGFVKYSVLCSVFCYVLNNYNKNYVRKIFIKLVRNGFFEKKQNIKRSYTYKYIKQNVV